MSAQILYTKGARVWLPDETNVWVTGEICHDLDSNLLSVQITSGEVIAYDIEKNGLPPLRNPEVLVGENDLTTLSYLHEPAVLHNLKMRFEEYNTIYTYCGIVLVAINPYEEIPLYGLDIISAYNGASMGEMDPHIFAVAEDAFRTMSREEQNQSIIVSGESGAGKTVSAKYAMRYFAAVGGSESETHVEKKVLASNPVMEAFGNAKTIRNDNSSRFGKYLEINFNRNHHIIGAHMRTYLLEKSRVVFQAPDERNYHIFYQLCAQKEEQKFKNFRLGDPDDFLYLNQGENPCIDGVDDAEQFEDTCEAFDLLGVHQDEQAKIFQVLAAILHLGNIDIGQDDGRESTFINNDDFHLAIAAFLLGIDKAQFQKWLCFRKIVAHREIVIGNLNLQQATVAKESLSKHIYAQVFNFIVASINKALMPSDQNKAHSFIGVLDIYGFETFEVNSFEQFCINYANEKLQQQFTMHVFKLEQEEYVREEIDWSFIKYYDNQPCIDLIEGKLGILDLLDEECKLTKASDENWTRKLYQQHIKKQPNVHFKKPRMSEMAFLVVHFADTVSYESEGFLEKNRDSVNEEHILLLKASEDSFVGELFTEQKAAVPQQRKRAHSKATAASSTARKTVGSQFRDSLTKLMETLNSTTPHYVRCIKPNDEKRAFTFEPKRAMQQLRACGVLETIKISAAGYPSRWSYVDFFYRYRMLVKWSLIKRNDTRLSCENILNTLLNDPDKYQFGKTKIFFRAGQVAYLEKLRGDKLHESCVMIQKTIRCWQVRKQYLKIRNAAIVLQAWARGYQARRLANYLRRTKAAITLQTNWRCHKARGDYLRLRYATLVIQSQYRGRQARLLKKRLLYEAKAIVIQRAVRAFLGRRSFIAIRKKIILLQCCVRRLIAKREMKKLKIEARSVEHYKNLNRGMENKIISLQQRLTSEIRKNEALTIKLQEVGDLRMELEAAKIWKTDYQTASATIVEYEKVIKELKQQLAQVTAEKDEVLRKANEEKEAIEEESEVLRWEIAKLKQDLKGLEEKEEKTNKDKQDEMRAQFDIEKSQILAEIEAERSHHQRILRDYNRLQQRYENLQDEVEILQSPTVSPNKEPLLDANDEHSPKLTKTKQQDSLIAELKQRIKELEINSESTNGIPAIEVSLHAEKGVEPNENPSKKIVHATDIQSLTKENNKLNTELNIFREIVKKRESVSEKDVNDSIVALKDDNIQRITKERDSYKQEYQKFRSELIRFASVSKDLADVENKMKHNPDLNAYILQASALKQANEVLQRELQDLLVKETDLQSANEKLWNDIAKLKRSQIQNGENHSLTVDVQSEISRLVEENLDLKEQIEKLEERLKNQQQNTQAKNDHENFRKRAASWNKAEAELRRRTSSSHRSSLDPIAGRVMMNFAGLLRKNPKDSGDVPVLEEGKKRGMIEFAITDVDLIVKQLIHDLSPGQVSDQIPGLPAHLLFMCVRYCDHVNDDEKLQTLLTSSISAIGIITKKSPHDLDVLVFWLSNTCRLLHDLKQYSGDKAFQTHNTPEQNEHCLKNFDLTEYRQLLDDLAVHIYNDILTAINESIQGYIVPGLLEFESIPAVSSSKPFGRANRQRTRSNNEDVTVKTITKYLSYVLAILNTHCVDPDIIKQVFRQIFHFIGASMLNNILLRKDMCHWSRGMQIRFNLSVLEDWVRINQLDSGNILEGLKCIIQATQLLQVSKSTLDDVDAICEVCSSLNTLQVQKILSMYTPSNDREARVPAAVIRAVVQRAHNETDPMYLMVDANKTYSVSFAFTASAVSLENITIPDSINSTCFKVI